MIAPEPSPTGPRPWHISTRHHHDGVVEDGPQELDETSPAPGADAPNPLGGTADGPDVFVLPPLWKRVVTGQSFGWRIRRVRNRVRWARRDWARRTLRYLDLNPAVRKSLKRGDVVTAVRSARRSRAVVGGGTGLVDHQPARAPIVNVEPAARGIENDYPFVIDTRRWNPAGFDVRVGSSTVRLRDVASGEAGDRLERRMLQSRNARLIRVGPLDEPDLVVARRVTEIAASGGLLFGTVPDGVSALLPEPLVTAIGTRYRTDDEVSRERHSVRVRRAALRYRSELGRRIDVAGGRLGVSVLLPSNRPMDVLQAVGHVSRQRDVSVQLVVGLHGSHMPAELDAQISDAFDGDDLVIHRFDDEQNLGQILEAMAVSCDGVLTSKWDDDDWYDVWHLQDLALALDYSNATIVGKAAEFVYLDNHDLTIRRFANRAERWSTTIGGGALMGRTADLREVGWEPIPRRVDRALIDGVEARGGTCYRTHGFGYVLRRRATGHTWAADDDYFVGQAKSQRVGLDLEFAGVETA